MKVSILVAMYNEANSIGRVLERVAGVAGIEPEFIVVDNGSSDNCAAIVEEFARSHAGVSLQLIRFAQNQGKGAAIRAAIAQARCEFCIIQDADFEYDPEEYPKLLRPLSENEADMVMGSRFLVGERYRPLGYWQAAVNRLISHTAGMASGMAFSDVETGFKAFRTTLAQSIPLQSNTFGLDPEIVIQFAKRRARFVEVPIDYRGRTYEQGKKIRPLDTLDALWTIWRTQWFAAAHKDAGAQILAAMSRAKRFNQWMADTIRPYVQGDVLELGAGIGNLTMLLAGAGRNYVATDSDGEAIRELEARMAYRRDVATKLLDFTNAEEMARFGESADTVVCLNALEHVEDDEGALRNIYGCLRPGGRAVILVPQGPEVFGSIDEVLEHKRRYTRVELRDKMTRAGFELERMIEFNRATRPGWYLNSRVLRRKTISPLQLCLFDWLVPIWRRVDGALPWASNSLIAIGTVKR